MAIAFGSLLCGGFVVVVMVSLSMIIDWNASFGVSLSVVGFIVD
ncbi:hypothetical protein [Luteococcus japonicus]|nr:hypothetical protein [Luteococcus japonicus]